MANQQSCSCSGGIKLIFACSGAADVGEIADRAARKMSQEGAAKMFCMAGIGGRVPGIMKTTEAAADILAIDGCELDCTRKSLQEAGFKQFKHLQLTKTGMEKGKTPPTPENIDKAAVRGKEMLA